MISRLLALCALVMAGSCADKKTPDVIAPPGLKPSLAITNVNVITMQDATVLTDQVVLVTGTRITAIGPRAKVDPTGALQVIDGKGGYLLPGLIDMHVHIRNIDLPEYLRYGVTTVRSMWGYKDLPPVMREIQNGTRAGPRIYSLSSGFDGSPAVWPQTQLSDDVGAIRDLITLQYEQGYREIKVYQKLTRAAYDTIVAIARRNNMTIAGHRPTNVPLEHVLASGQRSIEHLGGYSTDQATLATQVKATVDAGTYNCPTLAIQAGANPGPFGQSRRDITGALYRGGAKLLVGTDSGIGFTVAGKSMAEELAQFVLAGVPPYHALLGATRTAAEYLGLADEIGTIQEGHLADLVLLRANPLADIAAVKDIEAVIQRGKRIR